MVKCSGSPVFLFPFASHKCQLCRFDGLTRNSAFGACRNTDPKLGVVFDVVQGRMFSNVVSFQLTNTDTQWHTVEYRAIASTSTPKDVAVTSDIVRATIAPGQTRSLTINVTLANKTPDQLLSAVDADVDSCTVSRDAYIL